MLNIIIESIKYLDLKTSTGELNVDWRAELITLKVRLIRLLYIQCACGYSTLSSVTDNLTNYQHLNFLHLSIKSFVIYFLLYPAYFVFTIILLTIMTNTGRPTNHSCFHNVLVLTKIILN